jgi:hypothetical protein
VGIFDIAGDTRANEGERTMSDMVEYPRGTLLVEIDELRARLAAAEARYHLPETQLEVECEELKQAVEALATKLDGCFSEACTDLYEARGAARQLYRLQIRWSETERKFVQKTEWLSQFPWLERKDGPNE